MKLTALTPITLTALTLLTFAHGPLAAPGKTPSAKKPAGGPVVLGTTQMPGDFGKFGQAYTIGKSQPINVTLRRAEYSIAPIAFGDQLIVPKADEKLLVLHYTVHNPLPQEQRYYWSDLRFTAVDDKDTNHKFVQNVSREGLTEALSINLKPAQKLDVVTAILVPAQGVVPKLIVERETGAPVIRYALRTHVAALPAGVADPSDPSGATVLAQIPAKVGAFYKTGVFETRLEQTAYADGSLGGQTPPAGQRFATATFTLRNTTKQTQRLYWADFKPEIIDTEGEKGAYAQRLLKATRDETAQAELAPGEEARVRFVFTLPANVEAKTVTLAEGRAMDAREARVFAFDLSTVRAAN